MKLYTKYFSSFLIIFLFRFCFARDPVKILPKNPNDPERLLEGVTKKVLVIGNTKLTLNWKKDINL